MENNISYIPMETDFRNELSKRYTGPLKTRVVLLTIILWGMYFLVVAATSGAAKDSVIPLHGKSGQTTVNFSSFLIGLAIVTLILLSIIIMKFLEINLSYKQDADFGQIVKEQTLITGIDAIPAGYNIYYLSSDAIKTFIPDPYRNFREGDRVTIYYLKYSKEYLAYEL